MPPIVPRLNAAIVLHAAFLGDALPARLPIVTDAWAWPDDDERDAGPSRARSCRRPRAPVAAACAVGFAALTAAADRSLAGAVSARARHRRPRWADLAALDAGHAFVAAVATT
jgi:hypothetical protein